MVTNYERGREAEWKAQKALEAAGWTVVRSASSKSPVDLVALDGDATLLIQLKRSKVEIKSTRAVINSYGEDFKNLAAIRCPPDTIKELWLYTDRKGWRIFILMPDGTTTELDKEQVDRIINPVLGIEAPAP